MIHVLDTHQLGTSGIVAATAVETREGLVLFDTGPESTFDNVAAELGRIGFAPTDVRHVFLSHIHFDHAGAAWRFAKLGATIYVHPRGARHLIDPTKLIASAERIFGDAGPLVRRIRRRYVDGVSEHRPFRPSESRIFGLARAKLSGIGR